MTVEIVSPIYENVSIRDWAQSVRQIKINELRNKVGQHEKAWKTFCRMTDNMYVDDVQDDYIKTLNGLKEKINILETK